MSAAAYLDIYIGHQEEHDKEKERYEKTKQVLKKNAVIYGFPNDPEQLSVEQRETLREVEVMLHSSSLTRLGVDRVNVEVAGHAVCCAKAVVGRTAYI